jgi:dihydrofolate synthase/folylpolyglutamate synthase
MAGVHQGDNAALAVAMLRHQDRVHVSPEAMAEGIRAAHWPARMQTLGAGPLTALAMGHAVWLDGGHNPDAGTALAKFFAGGHAPTPAQRLHLVIGMLANKAPEAITTALGDRIASLQAVPVPGHEFHPAEAFGPGARAAADLGEALSALPDDGLPVLIAGSLYLAGEALRLNRELPD